VLFNAQSDEEKSGSEEKGDRQENHHESDNREKERRAEADYDSQGCFKENNGPAQSASRSESMDGR